MPDQLTRRGFLVSGTAAAGIALAPRVLRAQPAPATAERWKRYGAAFVIDALGGPGRGEGALDASDLADIRASGMTAVNLTLGSVGKLAGAFEDAVQAITATNKEIAAHPDVLMKVTHGAQLDEAKRTSRLGIIYGFQDTLMYGDDLERFEVFHQLGVRIVQLTYNRRNLMGDGCLEPGNAGLSRLGRDLVARMNERGALIDLSHSGQRTTHEAIEASSRPVAITHSGCAALTESPRNKRDEELRLLADRGGVVGIYMMPFLRTEGQVQGDDVIRHLEHALKLCGEDHVGIGTDGSISAVNLTPEYKKRFAEFVAERARLGIAAPGERPDSYLFAPDLNTPRRFEDLALRLSRRGHPDARIEKVLGGNWARLFRDSFAERRPAKK